VQDLKNTKPSQWWREVKQLCGCKTTTLKDLRSILKINNDCSDQVLANMINEAFINVTKDYTSLTDDVHVTQEEDDPIQVSLTSVQQKLCKISISRANGTIVPHYDKRFESFREFNKQDVEIRR
jgi:hypothetical protein